MKKTVVVLLLVFCLSFLLIGCEFKYVEDTEKAYFFEIKIEKLVKTIEAKAFYEDAEGYKGKYTPESDARMFLFKGDKVRYKVMKLKTVYGYRIGNDGELLKEEPYIAAIGISRDEPGAVKSFEVTITYEDGDTETLTYNFT